MLRLVQTDCVKRSGIESFLTACVFRMRKTGLPYCVNAFVLRRSERAFRYTYNKHSVKIDIFVHFVQFNNIRLFT